MEEKLNLFSAASFQNFFSLTPKDLNSYLNKRIVGQEKAQKMISCLVYNHLKRIYINFINETSSKSESSVKKTNGLFLGPTGC
ncbi:MAG: hypothetical protein MHPSP_002392, partial [Paramarteilia canceri]